MAKDLKALIRLRSWEVDERRRELAELYGRAAELEARREALERQLAQEQSAVAGETSFGFTYAAYGRRVIEQREEIGQQQAALEADIEAAQIRVADAFRGLKSIEQVQEARDRAAREELKRLEQAELDELAAQKHFRGGGMAG